MIFKPLPAKNATQNMLKMEYMLCIKDIVLIRCVTVEQYFKRFSGACYLQFQGFMTVEFNII